MPWVGEERLWVMLRRRRERWSAAKKLPLEEEKEGVKEQEGSMLSKVEEEKAAKELSEMVDKALLEVEEKSEKEPLLSEVKEKESKEPPLLSLQPHSVTTFFYD